MIRLPVGKFRRTGSGSNPSSGHLMVMPESCFHNPRANSGIKIKPWPRVSVRKLNTDLRFSRTQNFPFEKTPNSNLYFSDDLLFMRFEKPDEDCLSTSEMCPAFSGGSLEAPARDRRRGHGCYSRRTFHTSSLGCHLAPLPIGSIRAAACPMSRERS